MNDDENSGYFDDDGEKLNPNLISKPDLCTTCRKDEVEDEEILCNLNGLIRPARKSLSVMHMNQNLRREKTVMKKMMM